MNGDNNYDYLVMDNEYQPIIQERECEEFKPIINDFVQTYVENADKPTENWLSFKLKEYLPEKTEAEIQIISQEIIETITVNEEKAGSLRDAVANGRSKEGWFASEVKNATSAMSMQESAKYLTDLDLALNNANESLYRTIITQSGSINQNPCLDGFISEQYHAQTFNLHAEATGSPYRAKVLEPNGTGYSKNSVDIVIVDSNGKVVKRYQSKYCKDAEATAKAFENGDYRGQQKLVPEGQENAIEKKCTNVIEAPDGTTSNPLSKSRAEQMRDEAQSGKWNDLNWNEYKAKDLAVGIGKQAGYAALQGAAISVGFDVAQKLWHGEEIKGEEIVETAIKSGADFGIKAAAAGALKVGVEKNIIKVIPKGTPASTIANIAYVAIENIKILKKMATKELSFVEGLDKLEQTTVSTTAGLIAMGKGTAIGASVGAVFGPVGTAIGGFVGGTVGYMAGSKVGEVVVKTVQKVRKKVREIAKETFYDIRKTYESAKETYTNFKNRIKNIFAW
ncbi:MAG: hypothetical protein IJE93_02260 [Clostridia bacterium]|nr:hypothetical protein [Clostridia bacterium]